MMERTAAGVVQQTNRTTEDRQMTSQQIREGFKKSVEILHKGGGVRPNFLKTVELRGFIGTAQTVLPLWTIFDCKISKYFLHFRGGGIVSFFFRLPLETYIVISLLLEKKISIL